MTGSCVNNIPRGYLSRTQMYPYGGHTETFDRSKVNIPDLKRFITRKHKETQP